MNGTIVVMVMMLSSFLAALGQVSLKIGSMRLNKSIASMMKNFAFLAGVFLYGFSSILCIIALKGGELTVLYPVASLNYVWVSLLSMKYLKEKMNKYKWGGIALIMVGVILIV